MTKATKQDETRWQEMAKVIAEADGLIADCDPQLVRIYEDGITWLPKGEVKHD